MNKDISIIEEKRTLLVVEDNDMNRELLSLMLEDSFHVLQASNGFEGLDILNRLYQDISVILLDMQMPVMNGYEFLEKIKADRRTKQIPVIVTTSANDTEEEEKCLKMGASDFVNKPYVKNIVLCRTRNLIELSTQSRAATTDILTGAYNRLGCQRKVEQNLRERVNGTFGILDYKHFKEVNTRFGQAVGDKLLVEIARTIESFFPSTLVARLGADEFAVVRRGGIGDGAHMNVIIQHLYAALDAIKIPEMGDYQHYFSIGITEANPNRFTNFDEIYRVASLNMNAAKRHDGNYVVSDQGGVPDIHGVFKKLLEDRTRYNQLNDQLFRIRNQEDWFNYQQKSAEMKETMCQQNHERIQQLFLYYQRKDVLEEDFTLLYNLVVKYRGSLDPFLSEDLVGTILLPHNEKCGKDDELTRGRLCKLYLHMSDCLIDIYHMGDQEILEKAISMLKKATNIGTTLPDDSPAIEYYLYTLCQILGRTNLPMDDYFSPEERDAYYQTIRLHLNHPMLDPALKRHYRYLTFSTRIYPVMRLKGLLLQQEPLTAAERREIKEKSAYIKSHLTDKGWLDSCQAGETYQEVCRILVDHLLMRKSHKQLLGQERKLLKKLVENNSAEVRAEYITAASHTIDCILDSLAKGDSTASVCRKTAGECWDSALILMRKRNYESTDLQTNYMASKMLRYMMRFPYLTFMDKCEKMYKSISVLTLDTYSHSKALAAYAKIITESIIDRHPEMLLQVAGQLQTVEDVKRNKKEILQLMESSCLLHDVGKMEQVPIISNSYRKLTDHEFRLIKRHPELGISLLSSDSAFIQYSDVIRGHHKWADGKGGYPFDYDNTVSPMRILVDIISICDSLEAATSHIGRNYRHAKKFSDLMDEFVMQSGSRYNQAVVQSIMEDRHAYLQLRDMIENNWQALYQSIYKDLAS